MDCGKENSSINILLVLAQYKFSLFPGLVNLTGKEVQLTQPYMGIKYI